MHPLLLSTGSRTQASWMSVWCRNGPWVQRWVQGVVEGCKDGSFIDSVGVHMGKWAGGRVERWVNWWIEKKQEV